uniref:Uncharacterized protein n=1 Tax=Prymnesium polylepis TaxID=72548 RepID=A0A6V3YRX0_9EUKA
MTPGAGRAAPARGLRSPGLPNTGERPDPHGRAYTPTAHPSVSNPASATTAATLPAAVQCNCDASDLDALVRMFVGDAALKYPAGFGHLLDLLPQPRENLLDQLFVALLHLVVHVELVL